MSKANEPQLIIIKKKKARHGDHGHHGGAWKVAYADFVTAMMAFFLLLWLLNVTTDDQKQGIADYFDPSHIARATSGANGVLGGRTVSSPGQQSSPSSPFSMNQSLPGRPEPAEDALHLDDGSQDELADALVDQPALSREELAEILEELSDPALSRLAAEGPTQEIVEAAAWAGVGRTMLEEAIAEAQAKREEEQFQAAAEQLREAIESSPELDELADNLLIDHTPEGLRIQIVDQEGQSMFPIGSPEMHERTRQLMTLVAQVVQQMPQDISITGHTDAAPYQPDARYGNWELSTDRANASRRALVEAGLTQRRIAYVVGKADTDPLLPEEPLDPRNRRISIVLLRSVPIVAGGPQDNTPGRQAAADIEVDPPEPVLR